MKSKTAIIDYGLGNLRSVSKALELCGADVDIISSADEIKKYNSIVLPGVGSFGPAINIIKSKGLDIAIKDHIADKKMFLGICLGFQLLFSEWIPFRLKFPLLAVEWPVESNEAKERERYN